MQKPIYSKEFLHHLQQLVKGITAGEVMKYEFDSLSAGITVKDAACILMSNHAPNYVVMNGPVPEGSIERMEIIKAIAEMRYDTTIGELSKRSLICFETGTMLEDVMELILNKPGEIYPVFRTGSLAGVLDLQHIIEYLVLHHFLSGEEMTRQVKNLLYDLNHSDR
jgi:predicted transcriptional regulator